MDSSEQQALNKEFWELVQNRLEPDLIDRVILLDESLCKYFLRFCSEEAFTVYGLTIVDIWEVYERFFLLTRYCDHYYESYFKKNVIDTIENTKVDTPSGKLDLKVAYHIANLSLDLFTVNKTIRNDNVPNWFKCYVEEVRPAIRMKAEMLKS